MKDCIRYAKFLVLILLPHAGIAQVPNFSSRLKLFEDQEGLNFLDGHSTQTFKTYRPVFVIGVVVQNNDTFYYVTNEFRLSGYLKRDANKNWLNDSVFHHYLNEKFDESEMHKRIKDGSELAKLFWKYNKDEFEKEHEQMRVAMEAQKESEWHSTLLELQKKFAQQGILILNWQWGYNNEYNRSPEISINVVNLSKKKLKYVHFTFAPTNAVGDPVDFLGQTRIRTKGIGPIAPLETASWNFEPYFANKTIDQMKISQIRLEYFDGTIKQLIGKNIPIMPDEDN